MSTKRSSTDAATRPAARRAFTLVEMLLVLALVAVLAALAWPAIRGPVTNRRLHDAARGLQVELTRARLDAVRTATVREMRITPGTRGYNIADASAAQFDANVNATDGEVATRAARRAPATGTAGERVRRRKAASSHSNSSFLDRDSNYADDLSARAVRLPEGITFLSDAGPFGSYDLASDDPSAWFDSGESTAAYPPGDKLPTDAIWFHTDGTTSDARIILEDEYGNYVVVSLRGLTGAAKVSRILSAEELP